MADANVKQMEVIPLVTTSLPDAEYKTRNYIHCPRGKVELSHAEQDDTTSWTRNEEVRNNLQGQCQQP